ncbi:MAG: hypothetical protein U5L00_13555 [Desulfovermiculus sp.]|nr:hypothetical protein [Desulfovermiculus sp.]
MIKNKIMCTVFIYLIIACGHISLYLAHTYYMALKYENKHHGDKIWMPVPKVWDGYGTKNVKKLNITPKPTNRFVDTNTGTEIAY